MLRTLFKDFSILFIVRVFSRVIDFFLNIFVIRAIDPDIFASTVHFQLIMNVALFYTKTCLKNSYQKRAPDLSQSALITSASNLMMLGVPICLLISIFMVAAENLLNDSQLKFFFSTALLYGVSSVVESLQEAFATKLVL
jgi:O-antigen/teichoic acid export membrane protein